MTGVLGSLGAKKAKKGTFYFLIIRNLCFFVAVSL